MKKILGTTLIIAIGSSISMAGVIVTSELDDQTLYGDGTGKWDGQTTDEVGGASAARSGSSFVMAFKLPTLSTGESVSSASFTINQTTTTTWYNGDPAWNIDLYGLRGNNSSAIDAGSAPKSDDNGDFFIGENDVTSATKIQDTFVAVPTGINNGSIGVLGLKTTSAAGDIALGAWLQTFYTGSTPNQTYVFLRLNPDLTQTDGMRDRKYTFGTANNGGAVPTLDITTIPEPATLGLVASFAGAIIFIRRKFII